MKYKYSALWPQNPSEKWIKRPMVNVEIFGKNGSKKFNALIDSGADYCIFNIQIATLMGFDLSNSPIKPTIGIGGNESMPTYFLDDVEIKIENIDRKVKIPVCFIDSDSVGLLLGQNGFFDSFNVKFMKKHDTFEVDLAK
ncbi:MAG: retropepsin-like aspartic protease [Candidatus Paceibacterota bacterium]